MPYKISGTLSDAARIIIIKESDWSIESNTEESSSYEIDSLDSGYKWVIARKSDGESLGYGYVDPIYYTPLERGVFSNGSNMNYITIGTLGNSVWFGSMSQGNRYDLAACSNGTNQRGVFAGGYDTGYNHIDYITINSPGNAATFGELTYNRCCLAGTSNGTGDKGLFAGGRYYYTPSYQYRYRSVIEYVTISTTGNATYCCGLSASKGFLSGTSNGTNDRAVFAGGSDASTTYDVIDYMTISTLSSTADFGDLTQLRRQHSSTSNLTGNRGLFASSTNGTDNSIDYITISSIGNATDFGDLTMQRKRGAATSDGTRNRGVFGGGEGGAAATSMGYLNIASLGNASSFGTLNNGSSGMAATSNA